ncbi:hypothetical protein [Chryseosolibacter indicus]|uniref:Uncharacterized protein n=1 Tax=Chryseosolibacter indicus TaxID=2782351 RepID=A0ABS5VQ83_9BACT|nr:hypothetical protein [Chryseosolibacter indicus]MBT1703614.1 hypothetical protein [Chryseosolibacter indicus]
MNLVFGSLFLFILISPGLFFRFSYLQGSYAKLTFKVSAVEEIFWALVPALLFQLAGMWVTENVFNTSVNLDIVYQLITGEQSNFQIIKASAIPFSIYITVLLIIGVVCGLTTRALVRVLRLDLYLKFLRFGNEWYYLLSGESLNLPIKKRNETWYGSIKDYFKSLRKKKTIPLLIQVDALVNSSEGDMIYSGVLKDFFLSKDNGLDRIYLSNVYRRSFRNDLANEENNPGFLARDTDERYYTMPGYAIVISYDKIQNLNITYYLEQNFEDEVTNE